MNARSSFIRHALLQLFEPVVAENPVAIEIIELSCPASIGFVAIPTLRPSETPAALRSLLEIFFFQNRFGAVSYETQKVHVSFRKSLSGMFQKAAEFVRRQQPQATLRKHSSTLTSKQTADSNILNFQILASPFRHSIRQRI